MTEAATGVVEDAPGGELARGTQVATMMGGMGRSFDGGDAEYVLVPAARVIQFRSDLPWEVLGAVPETLQTAHGPLAVGVQPTRARRSWCVAGRPRSAWRWRHQSPTGHIRLIRPPITGHHDA